MKIKKYRYISIASVLVLSAVMLCGCKDERLEDELAYRKIGINSMEAGDYEDAVSAFDTALSKHIGAIGETELDISYYRAAAQYAAGDIDGALESYQNLLNYDKEDGKAYYMKGCILLQQDKSKEALECFANAVQYSREAYELYVGIYENLASYNLAEEGETYLKQAFDIKGDSAENLAWRGKIYLMLEEYENAETELKAALGKESAVANLYLAQVYDAQGDSENAEHYYQAYLETGAEDSVAMNALAELAIAKGNYEMALQYANQGMAMGEVPNKRALMQNQIIACEYTGDFAAAWEIVQEYVALYPEDMSVQREYTFLKNRQGVQEEVPETAGTEEVLPEETETIDADSTEAE